MFIARCVDGELPTFLIAVLGARCLALSSALAPVFGAFTGGGAVDGALVETTVMAHDIARLASTFASAATVVAALNIRAQVALALAHRRELTRTLAQDAIQIALRFAAQRDFHRASRPRGHVHAPALRDASLGMTTPQDQGEKGDGR